MACDSPIQAYRASQVNPATGKRPLVFKVNGSFSGVRQMLPCGKCAGCRLEHSRRWAIRLMHENKMHQFSEFVTLTYRNEDLPEFGTLVPSHLQGFHKRLHNRLLHSRGRGIRYYGVGEYGDLSLRPHYHSILFDVMFPDKRHYSTSAAGHKIYTSKVLDEIWGFGECKIAEVTFETAAYVARYCMKKVDGKKREDGHYVVYNADGVVCEREPEFSHMSRRPGIGATYFDKYGSEIACHDTIIVNGRAVPSIRYYDQRIEKLDAARIAAIKKKRRPSTIAAVSTAFHEKSPDRRRVKEKLRIATLKQKKRQL